MLDCGDSRVQQMCLVRWLRVVVRWGDCCQVSEWTFYYLCDTSKRPWSWFFLVSWRLSKSHLPLQSCLDTMIWVSLIKYRRHLLTFSVQSPPLFYLPLSKGHPTWSQPDHRLSWIRFVQQALLIFDSTVPLTWLCLALDSLFLCQRVQDA